MSAKTISRFLLAAIFFMGGIGHFTHGGEFARIVPPIFPYPLQIVWITGTIEFLFAAALLQSRFLPAIGKLLSLYLLAVLTANIYQAVAHISIFAQYLTMPTWAAWLRVALQFPLIAWILWATNAWTRAESPALPD
jgi:uncharacterized membrane protein